MTRIVLASGSSARRTMLTAAGVKFEAAAPDIDEASVKAKGGAAREIAEKLASLKALASSREIASVAPGNGDLVIGSDQTLELNRETFSKSGTLEGLRATLLRLRGATHVLHSAVAVARDGAIVWSRADSAHLTMRAFSDAFLDGYIVRNGENVRSSLGGYWFEAEGVQLFDKVEGDYFTILGMPLLPLLAFLRGAGALSS